MKYTMRRGFNRFRESEYGRQKFCAYCHEWWAVQHFDPHPRGQGGLDNRCRACRSERRTSRTAAPLALALLALLLGACNAYSANDRQATWCVERSLYAAAVSAAEEWRIRSDGEVDFTVEHLSLCDAPLRVVIKDLPGEYGGLWSLDKSAVLIEPGMSNEGVRVALLHEWGHYLTGREHSSDPEDVMYERYGAALHLSDADVARLDWDSRRVTVGYFP